MAAFVLENRCYGKTDISKKSRGENTVMEKKRGLNKWTDIHVRELECLIFLKISILS